MILLVAEINLQITYPKIVGKKNVINKQSRELFGVENRRAAISIRKTETITLIRRFHSSDENIS